jgi:uncharacterized protein YacL
MASVSVFVDDAVQGNLPGVCLRTGGPANRLVKHESGVGGAGASLLLIFLGPVGWIALVILATWRREVLTVWLPYSDAAIAREQLPRQVRTAGLIGAVVSILLAVTMSSVAAIWVVLAVLCGVAALVANIVLYWGAPGIRLDASRRWVTLTNVHADFAASVQRVQADAIGVGRNR